MRKIFTILAVLSAAALSLGTNSRALKTNAQSDNARFKVTVTEQFVFPNDCTGELMDVSDTTVVICHDQLRADGTFNEKCTIVQDVTAVGETTGIVWHGNGAFQDETIATDECNFTATNVGKVKLISNGNAPNLILSFDDLVRVENCELSVENHLGSFDCRGGGKP
jgi:hypothetical protein